MKRILLAILFLLFVGASAGAERNLDAQALSEVMFGAWMNGQGTFGNAPWDPRTIDLFEQHAGKKVSIVHWGQQWWRNGAYQPLWWAWRYVDAMRARGTLSLIDWSPWDTAVSPITNQPRFSLSAIVRGDHDAYIQQSALSAKTYGKAVMFRPFHEMNGSWYPWSEGQNGNRAGDFVLAWRHVVDIFNAASATNVTWVWCPNTIYPGSLPLAGLYPGDAYVDWVCLDAYNFGASNWKSFTAVLGPSYDEVLKIAPAKPLMLGEWASSENGGNKAAWILDAHTQLRTRFPNVKAILWFNWNADGRDWVIESSEAAQTAMQTAVAPDYFASNSFAGVTGKVKALKPVPSPTPTSTTTPTRTNTSTSTPIATNTPTQTPSPTPTNTPTPTETSTPTMTPTPTEIPCEWVTVYENINVRVQECRKPGG